MLLHTCQPSRVSLDCGCSNAHAIRNNLHSLLRVLTAGLSLKHASAVLYRTTFPTKKKKKKKIWKEKKKKKILTTDAGLHERITINRIRLVNLALLLGQDLKNTKKWMKRHV